MKAVFAGLVVLAGTSAAQAQSLFERSAPQPVATPAVMPAPLPAPAAPAPADATSATPAPAPAPIVVHTVMPPPAAPQLRDVSLFGIEPPEPRTFKPNDLITVIISERASLSRTQKEESEKSYDMRGAVVSFPDMLQLLQLRLENGRESNLPKVDLNYDNGYEGEGKYKREDKLTARVTARILEVKPNGTLLVEARTEVNSDNESQLIVLAGLCRQDDVTDQNTIQSSQLFDLKLDIQNTGDVRATSNKGLIPRVIETLFNF